MFFQKDELDALFKALHDERTSIDIRDFVRIALYTGARRTNVLSMQWKDINFDFKLWLIPADHSKNSEPMIIPLLPEVVTVLQERKKPGGSKYVFPGKGATGHLVEPKKGWKGLLKRAGLDESFKIHDLRRTMGSWQAITGSSTKIIGASLGHKSDQATSVYARLNIDPVRESMERAISKMLK